MKDVVEKCAEIAHEVNRAYCNALGDTSQVPWTEAPEWQKASVRNGVRMHINNPDTTPEQSHGNWLAEKTREGWRFGAVKDPEAKTHPCFLPYHELPPEQQMKDHLFRAAVLSAHKHLSTAG